MVYVVRLGRRMSVQFSDVSDNARYVVERESGVRDVLVGCRKAETAVEMKTAYAREIVTIRA